MKKLAYLLLALIVFMLVACTKSDEDAILPVSVENICGTWRQEATQTVIGKDYESNVIPLIVTMVFNEDQTCSILYETPENEYGIEDYRTGCKYMFMETDEKTVMVIYYTETDKDIYDVTVKKNSLILDGHGIEFELTRVN